MIYLKLLWIFLLVQSGYIDVNGVTYYIDITANGYNRDEAKTQCESLNMALISFERDDAKWLLINDWLYANGMETIHVRCSLNFIN